MRWLLAVVLVGLVGCAEKEEADGETPAVTEVETDTDTDTDVDTNTDADTDTTTPVDTAGTTPPTEICDDQSDNDADGDIDCSDSDCTLVCDADSDLAFGIAFGGTDCDDTDPLINPSALEVCDTLDNDCDTRIDDADPSVDLTTGLVQYQDADGDLFGDSQLRACELLAGNVLVAGDCDDSLPERNPGAPEICDEADNDCDPLVDEADPDLDPALLTTFYADLDADGAGDPLAAIDACFQGSFALAGDDCSDSDPTRQGPVDWYADLDGDGVGEGAAVERAACTPVDPTLSSAATDCAPLDAGVFPGNPEICADGIDQDCDGADNCHPGLSGVIDASDLELLLYAELPLQHSGIAVAAGDTDGDGLPNLVEASLDGSVAANSSGVAHIWAGPWAPGSLPLADAPVVISGEATDSEFYAALVSPDLTGDGLPDVVLGDVGFNAHHGRVYVIPGPVVAGGEIALLATVQLDGDVGTGAGYGLGDSDVDGDGNRELWVGDYRWIGGPGSVWCAEAPLAGIQSLTGMGTRILGTVADPLSALDFVTEDFDADGLDDVAFATPYANNVDGSVFVFQHVPVGTEGPADADVRIDGGPGDTLYSVASGGDVTGDGYSDLLIGAPGARSSDGSVYLVAGPLGPLAGAVVEVQGVNFFGQYLTEAGDMDLDGSQEFLMSSGHGAYDLGIDQAVVDLEGAAGVVALADVTQLSIVDSVMERLGLRTAVGTDFDGDGYPDAAMGAYAINGPGGFNSGGVRLLFGAPP